jgi:CheY-like chemotaxis protein
MTQPAPPSEDPASAARLVLVVDDEDDQRELLVTLVRRAGYRVVGAASGEDALTRLETVDPDLALIDLLLPGMDGAALSEQIRRRFPGCPIVLTSVLDVSDYPRADAVLPKPFSRAQMVAVLRRLLPS